jgi:hypothetical protein
VRVIALACPALFIDLCDLSMGEALIEILPNSLGSFVVDDTLTQVPGVTVWCESSLGYGNSTRDKTRNCIDMIEFSSLVLFQKIPL